MLFYLLKFSLHPDSNKYINYSDKKFKEIMGICDDCRTVINEGNDGRVTCMCTFAFSHACALTNCHVAGRLSDFLARFTDSSLVLINFFHWYREENTVRGFSV